MTRVAREVGTEGKLAARPRCRGLPARGRILTDTVNVMGANLTEQVRASSRW